MAGARAAMDMARGSAEHLSKLAEQILEKVPEAENWEPVRKFLQDTMRLLREGNVASGMRAFQRILPYVEKSLSQVDRYVHVSDIYNISESLSRHFLVEEAARVHLEKCLGHIRSKMGQLRHKLIEFGTKLDGLLEQVIKESIHVGFWTTVRLAFEMNRITSLIQTCEDRLRGVRAMLDDLDTHVAGKSFLAHLVTFLSVIASILFSVTGNLPVGAACFATATASRKSAKGLSEYRSKLAQINREHGNLQASLNEWRFRFRAEQRNFLLLVGLKYACVLVLLLVASFVVLGKAANFLFFALVVLYFVIRSEETNKVMYYAGLGLALLVAVMEIQKYNALIWFNTASGLLLIAQLLGFLEVI